MNTLPRGPDAPSALQALKWIRRPFETLEEYRDEYGDIFTIRFPGFGRFVVVGHPEGVKEVFAQGPDSVHAGKANVVLRPFLGDHSLLLLDGAEHQRQRKMILPAFHGERMHAYGRAMVDLTDQTIDALPVGRALPIHGALQQITLQVILRTVFGIGEGPRFTELAKLLSRSLDIIAWPGFLFPAMQRDLGPLTRWGEFSRIGEQVTATLLAEIRRARQPGASGRDDVLAMMIAARDEAGAGLGDQEIHDELITLLVAGHETTATALSWALRWILAEPGLQTRLADELRPAVEGGVAPEKVARLELLDGCVREALRLHPVIPLVGRVLQEPMTIMGYALPVGTPVAPSIYLVHHRPSLYPDSKRFWPERYRAFKPSPSEWLPFGGGIRRCIGAAFAIYEMKMVLATLFSRVTLRLAPGLRVRTVRRAITLTPSEGLPVVVSSKTERRRRPSAA